MHRELKPEDVGMDPNFVERNRKYYRQKDSKESERLKEFLRKSGVVGKLFVSKLNELETRVIIKSLEPKNSLGRYNHVRINFTKDGEEYDAWLQARRKSDFSLKYIKPLEDTLKAHIKHHFTPGDYVVVRQSLSSGESHAEFARTMTGAFHKLIEVIETA